MKEVFGKRTELGYVLSGVGTGVRMMVMVMGGGGQEFAHFLYTLKVDLRVRFILYLVSSRRMTVLPMKR